MRPLPGSARVGIALLLASALGAPAETIEVKSAAESPTFWEFETTLHIDGVPHQTFGSSQPFQIEAGWHRFEAPSEVTDAGGAPYAFRAWRRGDTKTTLGTSSVQDLYVDFSAQVWAIYAASCTLEMKSAVLYPAWQEFETVVRVDGVDRATFTSSRPFAVRPGSHELSAPAELPGPPGKCRFSHWQRESDGVVLAFDAATKAEVATSDRLWAIYVLAVEGVRGMKGMDFYPSVHSWDRMWTDWDPDRIAVELDHARDLGCGVVETYIQYPVFYDEASSVDAKMVARAKQFMDLVAAREMKVQFTLFDFVWDLGVERWKHHEDYLAGLVPALAKRSAQDGDALLAWGLKNEINLMLNHGFSVSHIEEWGGTMLRTLRTLDPGRPVEIEISRGPGFDTASFRGLLSQADRVGLSTYFWTEDYWQTLRDVVKVYADYGRPVVISEFGWTTWAGQEEKQRRIYENVLLVAGRTGVGVRAWCLMDYLEAWKEEEKHFGLVSVSIDAAGRIAYGQKPAYAVYRGWTAP